MASRLAPVLPPGKAAGLFKPGNHGSTFGGNQLATTAALTTIAVIERENLLANAEAIGKLIKGKGLSSHCRVWRAWLAFAGKD